MVDLNAKTIESSLHQLYFFYLSRLFIAMIPFRVKTIRAEINKHAIR